jgi:hypothetical protein
LSGINDYILSVAGLDVDKFGLDEGIFISDTELHADILDDLYCLQIQTLGTPQEVSQLIGFHDLKILLSYFL